LNSFDNNAYTHADGGGGGGDGGGVSVGDGNSGKYACIGCVVAVAHLSNAAADNISDVDTMVSDGLSISSSRRCDRCC